MPWYHYYANVSAADIRENLAVRAERFPALRYVQIDDGYQARMGTGSPPSAKFEEGWRPWQGRSAPPVASRRSGSPFIAEPGSQSVPAAP